MKNLLRCLAGLGAVALLAGFLFTGFAGTASAAGNPPWEPLANPPEAGGLLFFNAAGQEITGGSITSEPVAAYVEGTAVLDPSDSEATLEAYTPVSTLPPAEWSGEVITVASAYPNTSAPAPLNTSTLPVYTGSTNDPTLATYILGHPNTNTTSGYANLYVLRIVTSGPDSRGSTSYDSADISVTTTAGTWQVVYPAVTLTSTTTTLTASPPSPQVAGTSVTLNAAVSPSAAGTVQFEDGTTDIGTPVTVTDGSASTTWTATPAGTADLSAVFTPAQFSAYSGSTGTLTYTVSGAPAAGTTTGLTVAPTSAAADTSVTLTADVTITSSGTALGAGDGSVLFYDNGTSTTDTVTASSTLLGTEPLGTGGIATLTYSSFDTGAHNVVAEFEPADPSVYNSSVSPNALFTATAPLYTPDAQSVEVTIPAGTLTITTPYTAASPFNLGTATLNPGDGYFSATAPFGSDTPPAEGQTYQGITITDTGVGEAGWTASVTSTNFTGPGDDTINAQNLSFTGVTPLYITGNQYGTASGDIPVATQDVDSATWNAATGPTGVVYSASNPGTGTDGLAGVYSFADTTTPGGGSVYIYGNLNLVAPSSVTPGTYTATVTFTVA